MVQKRARCHWNLELATVVHYGSRVLRGHLLALILNWDDGGIASRGANTFPGAGGQAPSPEFTCFLDAVTGLAGVSLL
ncbi:MAG: hypothetical protein ABFC24_05875 [Methanoregulaceae archaeon]